MRGLRTIGRLPTVGMGGGGKTVPTPTGFAFDQGSYAAFAEESPGVYRITPIKHWSNTWAWWALKSGEFFGATPHFVIAKADHYNMVADEWLACWSNSPDTDTWHAFDHIAIGATDLEFYNDAAFPAGAIYISALPMYPFSRVQRKMSDWLAHSYVSDTASSTNGIIGYATARDAGDGSGRTAGSSPFYGFKLTNATVNTKNKAILTAYNHPSETPGAYQLEAAVDWLLSGSPEAEALLDWFEFYIYPCLNPQGVWNGYFRSSPQTPTSDNNRIWDTTGTNEAIDAIKAAMTADTGGAIEVGIDFHSYMDGSTIEMSVNDPAHLLTAAFVTAMQALDATYGTLTETTASTLKNVWLADYSANMAFTQEQGGAVARTVADWKTYGENTMKVLSTMQSGNQFTNHEVGIEVGSRDFNGATDRIDWASPATLTGSPLTVSAFVYSDGLAGTRDTILQIHQAGDAAAGIEWCLTSTVTVQFLRTGATSCYRGGARTGVSFTGQWLHVCVTHDGTFNDYTKMHIFINNVECESYSIGQNGATEAAIAGSWSIGGRKFDDTRNFDGKLAQVAVWNRVLTAGEIANLAAGYAPSFISDGLQFYAPLNTASLTATPGGDGTADGTTQLTGVGNGPAIIYP